MIEKYCSTQEELSDISIFRILLETFTTSLFAISRGVKVRSSMVHGALEPRTFRAVAGISARECDVLRINVLRRLAFHNLARVFANENRQKQWSISRSVYPGFTIECARIQRTVKSNCFFFREPKSRADEIYFAFPTYFRVMIQIHFVTLRGIVCVIGFAIYMQVQRYNSSPKWIARGNREHEITLPGTPSNSAPRVSGKRGIHLVMPRIIRFFVFLLFLQVKMNGTVFNLKYSLIGCELCHTLESFEQGEQRVCLCV